MKSLWKAVCAILTGLVCPAMTLASVSVSISPTTVQMQPGARTQFAATVSGSSNSVVLWSLTGTNCTGIACGQITSQGSYIAPSVAPHPNVITVTATALADLSASASAAAIIGTTSDITVGVSPASATVLAGHQQTFSASVSGTTITGVTWRIAGGSCSGTGCGSITPSGVYTAPSQVPTPAQVTVQAVSIADPSKSGSAVITVASPVSVNVSPGSATLVAGKQQQFTASVSNTGNTAVTWSLRGSGCSGPACGTISPGGLYTAPSSAPNPAQVYVTATSVADSSKSATATVTVVAPVGVKISPSSVQLLTGAQQQFTAAVSNSSNTGVNWSVAGVGCRGAACGSISAKGLYTAPSSAPSPAQVFVTATSVADATKSATASVTIIAPVAVSISPSNVQVITGGRQQFMATVTGSTNTAVSWSVSGTGCSGSACGTISTNGLYTAPAKAPTPNQVTVMATSVADTSKSAKTLVTISGPIAINISPASVQVALSRSQQFTATVTGTTNTAINWSITGPGCSGGGCGIISSTGLYTAPLLVPNPAQVFVTATSAADPTKSGTASVTLFMPIVVTLSPATETLTAGAQAHFVATVSGTTNTSVTWSVSGSGCSGNSCGTITSTGIYTAPASVPTPPQVTVKATSAANTSSSATATVTIIPPVGITISPTSAQVVGGERQQFSAKVTGNSNTGVTWSVSGKGCSGAACGVITSTGLYSAPGRVPNPAVVTVTATSTADKTKAASASVTILPSMTVTVSPSSAQVVTGQHQQFTAVVTSSQNTTVSWSLSGSGCSGSACGTISSAGLYTAPATVPSPAQVTVMAISDADTTKSGSATITIIPPVHLTITPASAVLAVSSQQQFEAIVHGSTNTGVDWSVSGPGCSGSACGTISSTGLYTAPGSMPSPATVIVKASARVDVSESASSTITLVASEDAKLKGQYAFQFAGFDANGIYQSAGSFTADGNGNITAGREDTNNTNGPATDLSFTGTYQVGGDNRGTMTFSTATGTQTFRFAVNLAGSSGRFIEFDATGIRGSGLLEKQDPAAFSDAVFKGTYALRLAGMDSAGARIGALGVLDLNGSGNIPGGSIDVNEGGTLAPTYSNFQGVYRIDGTGRGTLNLSVPGFDGGAFRFAFYVVSSRKVLLISIDPLSRNNPIFSGPMELQSGIPFLTSILNGATIFSLSGEPGTSGNSQALVGQIVFDGVSQPLVRFDENAGGKVTTGKVLTGGYSVELNGRGTLNLDDSSGYETVWLVYVISQNHAFVMDGSTASAGIGEIDPQTVQGPFSSQAIVGTYVLGSGAASAAGASLVAGVSTFDGKSGMSGKEDVSQTSGTAAAQPLAGAYSVPGSANTGRGTLVLTSPSGRTLAVWVASPAEMLGLDLSSSDAQPVVLLFEQ